MPALKAIHDGDPRRQLLKKVGNLSWLRLRVNQILVAIYIRPEDAQFGTMTLKLADNTRGEDRFQGKVGLVIAMGPTAFKSDDTTHFEDGDTLSVGEWVVFRASDGWQMTLTGDGTDATKTECRVFVESDIRAVIPSPDMVW
jgi:hypothetical protein